MTYNGICKTSIVYLVSENEGTIMNEWIWDPSFSGKPGKFLVIHQPEITAIIVDDTMENDIFIDWNICQVDKYML